MKSFEKLALSAWLILAGTAGALASGLLTIGTLEKIPLCLFRLITGHPCPGCGMTHALLAAFQGRWMESFGEHPLGLPLLALWTFWLGWGLLNIRRSQPFSADFPFSGTRAQSPLSS